MQAAVIHPSSRLSQLPAGYSHWHGSMTSFVQSPCTVDAPLIASDDHEEKINCHVQALTSLIREVVLHGEGPYNACKVWIQTNRIGSTITE